MQLLLSVYYQLMQISTKLISVVREIYNVMSLVIYVYHVLGWQHAAHEDQDVSLYCSGESVGAGRN